MEEASRYRNNILSDLNERDIVDEMIKIKYENVKKYVQIGFVIICLLLMFLSLYFLPKYRFFLSLFFVLIMYALHFKLYFVDIIYNTIKRNDE